jgi:hypothetical protein
MCFLVMCFRVLELIDMFCTWGFLREFHWAVLVDVLFALCRIDCGSSS